MKYYTAIIISATFVMLTGCTSYNCYINGNSSVLSNDWKSMITIGETKDEPLVNLLGRPRAYYHHTRKNEMYVFYHSMVTIQKIYHVPFIPRAQFYSYDVLNEQTGEWFLFSNGILTEHVSSTSNDKNPDLTEFVARSSSDY